MTRSRPIIALWRTETAGNRILHTLWENLWGITSVWFASEPAEAVPFVAFARPNSAVLRGGDDAAEDQHQSEQQVPVRHGAGQQRHVVQHDDERCRARAA